MSAVKIIENMLSEVSKLQSESNSLPSQEKISGKMIKKTRQTLGMTQPKFAKLLSKQSGEYIDTKALCRMENYGKKKACHPIAPSSAVTAVVYSFDLWLQKKNLINSKEVSMMKSIPKEQSE